MANEITHSYDSTLSLYCFVRRVSDQYIYDVGDTAFEALGTWNDARAGECDIVMVASGDTHWADFPAVAAGVYFVEVREKAGANPDTDDRSVAQGVMYWDGTAEITPSTDSADLTTLEAKIDIIDTNVDDLIVDQNKVLNVVDETRKIPTIQVIVE